MHELAEEKGEKEGKTRDLGIVVERRREGEKEQAPLLAKHSVRLSIEQKKLTFFFRALNDKQRPQRLPLDPVGRLLPPRTAGEKKEKKNQRAAK